MDLKTILIDINNGDMARELDEKDAGGFWDYAGDIADDIILHGNLELSSDQSDILYDEVQFRVYGVLWELVESMKTSTKIKVRKG